MRVRVRVRRCRHRPHSRNHIDVFRPPARSRLRQIKLLRRMTVVVKLLTGGLATSSALLIGNVAVQDSSDLTGTSLKHQQAIFAEVVRSAGCETKPRSVDSGDGRKSGKLRWEGCPIETETANAFRLQTPHFPCQVCRATVQEVWRAFLTIAAPRYKTRASYLRWKYAGQTIQIETRTPGSA